MSVTTVRKELSTMLTIYWIIRDVLEGEPAIKGWIGSGNTNISLNAAAFNGGGSGPSFFTNAILAKAKFYLPMPNPTDSSTDNLARYKQYLTRAVFYGVTARTLEGMVGQIFLIPPIVKLPTGLESMLDDVDSDGLNFEQSSKRCTRYTMGYGRAGLYTDYPQSDMPITQQQISSGKVKPMIQLIAPWNVVNWRETKINGKNMLTQVVIREECDDYDDNEFTAIQSEQYRVLRLDEDTQVYTVQIYEGQTGNIGKRNTKFTPGEIITPKDHAGMPFKYIPFTFIGSENNDNRVDKPPMYDMASINIAHYRNSADYEESSYLVGQPTPWASGIDAAWYKDVLKEKIPLGSRAGIPLPVGATVGLLQANPNQMPLEAMKLKEDQMLALGAKLVTERRNTKTATQTRVDASSETSVLTNVSTNVSAAYTFAFKAACAFTGDDPSKVEVHLNKEFELNDLSPDDLSKVIAGWQVGAMTFSEMRETLRKAGLANVADDIARAAIQKDRTDGFIAPAVPPKPTSSPNPNSDPAGHSATATAAA